MARNSEDGQHYDDQAPAPNNGQRNTPRDPMLGKKAVPATAPNADTSTEEES